MNKIVTIIVSISLLASCKNYESPLIYVEGVSNPIIKLNGVWKINTNPSAEFWKIDILNEEWKDIQVPGECMMQGYQIKHDIPFVYKKRIDVPTDFLNKTIFLQFDGVYSYARVWINGNYVRDHTGGFTRWECDITQYATPGESAMLTVEVTDKADEISYASGYAKHQIGGILRDVNLIALPSNYPLDITINTDFDEDFENAFLLVSGKTKMLSDDSKISFELFDPSNKKVHIENTSIQLTNEQSFQIQNTINKPEKWDAEHPKLYQLQIAFTEKDKLLWQKTYTIGFREINLVGNKLLVNGKEVKLRGACRHDIHPLLGRVSTPDYELKDVQLAKEANFNFIRTSHYPPTENFLRLCDEYGLYVEDETAVCFVGSHRIEEYFPGASENDNDYTQAYLSQLTELVNNHKNHPSIIIWSIGNENSFGTNFKKSYDWVKENDPSRPVIYSYPGNVPDSIQCYDILSMHYPGIDGNLDQIGKITKGFGYSKMPVIFDEWAHVACYNNYTVKEDPNIRSFWGRSLDTMWQKTFEADGGLGGAIWGMIDETFMLPDTLLGFNDWWGKIDKNVIPAEYSGNTIGYGEWGIIDTWRRKKPEFWNTKKAYSPVKLLNTEIENYTPGIPVSIPLYNRFDHTNINELTIRATYQGKEISLLAPDIEPHNKGELTIQIKEWDPEQKIYMEFFDINNNLTDKYALSQASEMKAMKVHEFSEKIQIEEDEKSLTVICENNTMVHFNKERGLIDQIQNPSGTYKFMGPFINLRTRGKPVIYSYHKIKEYCSEWVLKSFDYDKTETQASFTIAGEYDDTIPVEFNLHIFSHGEIYVDYQIQNVPGEYIREIGVRFELDNIIDSLTWERNAYWSFYPDNHLSASTGSTPLYSSIQKKYRTEPIKEWGQDVKSFYYNGIIDERIDEHLTFSAKSTKENLNTYSLNKNGQEIISLMSNGSLNARLSKMSNKLNLFASNLIDYVDLSWGNYQRNIMLEGKYSNELRLKINTQ